MRRAVFRALLATLSCAATRPIATTQADHLSWRGSAGQWVWAVERAAAFGPEWQRPGAALSTAKRLDSTPPEALHRLISACVDPSPGGRRLQEGLGRAQRHGNRSVVYLLHDALVCERFSPRTAHPSSLRKPRNPH